jgi:hypothetical protein
MYVVKIDLYFFCKIISKVDRFDGAFARVNRSLSGEVLDRILSDFLTTQIEFMFTNRFGNQFLA